MSVFQDWLIEKKMPLDMLNYSAENLNQVLRSFHPSVQKGKGKAYSIASYGTLRAGIARHLPTCNIMNSGSVQARHQRLKKKRQIMYGIGHLSAVFSVQC